MRETARAPGAMRRVARRADSGRPRERSSEWTPITPEAAFSIVKFVRREKKSTITRRRRTRIGLRGKSAELYSSNHATGGTLTPSLPFSRGILHAAVSAAKYNVARRAISFGPRR